MILSAVHRELCSTTELIQRDGYICKGERREDLRICCINCLRTENHHVCNVIVQPPGRLATVHFGT
ncbi:conserved hypothetical protein [Histoplasma capsulatum G186AR]|uniref:Uncharacterized protein n=2 Tax=Ajellomyces capsulatus TaxID=5037 RepID=C0NUU7_AJECG|nr:uncharacterized protein HCBG_06711 [Histoplasma capsulatum G186AR]EEH04760.1 conserved hypothetical protein [Histoplasma capsulatum G186AR]KAG5287416.1 hypothetical protein I7I52_11182 [Histoplasma capsulatum]QSS70772.1 hypothetical protein I7I50_12511 [Histoplasma capsulatum G186AR]